MTSPHLNRTEWSNRHQATLEQEFSSADKGLCGSIERLTKPLLLWLQRYM